ncbi:pyridoxamine 5'-phosphate oxidase family protein [Chitinimonas sp. PSY-7]|uniref:pyridoxamine 5'-phosphate oxidase family protein n=1 Tax=Chitinimonas sp. PSY-7 TaxID=3459088 RepID=UPI00403FD088
MSQFTKTPLTRIRRIAENANYDRDTVHAILDTAWVCQISFSVDGQAHCIPTAHWRIGNTLYIHGSNGSRLLRALAEGASACVNVTHMDGLVLARSGFNHSMNYRSAMIYGQFRKVSSGTEKIAVLDAFMDKIDPSRREQVRVPDKNELAATTVLALTIEQAVAKQRSGPPVDDAADIGIDVWAGVWWRTHT